MRRALAVAVCCLALGAQGPQAPKTFDDQMGGLAFRNIGPFRGGRSVAVTGVKGQPSTFYFGATGGGVWKTTDAGLTWANVSDHFFKTGSVGALAVSESEPSIVYAGMGEAPIRTNASHGDGIYRSLDGGATWVNLGLKETRHISRIRIHPARAEVVYVAAQGHLYGPNSERGIYRTMDGGKTWKRVLFVDDRTGACDLAMDPQNPSVLYAGFWQVVRKPWELQSGGPGSSLWKSTDGGETWKRLGEGLPPSPWGKVGITASHTRAGRLWAIIEHRAKGGLYRSDDGGEKWTHVSDDHRLRERAFYYTWVYDDPKHEDIVWAPNVFMHRSVDGGKSWAPVQGFSHGDHHDLWIDPEHPDHIIVANDGGATISLNGGRSWSTQMNQPTAQFYRVATDDRYPYWVYGCQQDNSSVGTPSAVPGPWIDSSDWHAVGGGESGWVAPYLSDPEITYAGEYGGQVTRYDHRTGQTRAIMAWPELGSGPPTSPRKYRFNWNAPLLLSRHDPKVLYHGAQVLLKSTNEGQSWSEISPDLTHNDPSTLTASGGPITTDVTGAEVYASIFALAEASKDPQQIWAGTDDGRVHLTRDGGKSWAEVTAALRMAGMPDRTMINAIEASPFEDGTAYVVASHFKWNDFKPYLFRTTDYGKTWQLRTSGLPADSFVRVVREDPRRAGLLFAGTETGLHISFDAGATWRPFQRNLPAVSITDLQVKRDDLVVATQGRSFWVLDDLGALRQWKDDVASKAWFVFEPTTVMRMSQTKPEDDEMRTDVGQNREPFAYLDIWVKEPPKEGAALTIEVREGETLLRRLTTEKPEKEGPLKERLEAEERDKALLKDKPLELKPGLNRIPWDMRVLPPELAPKAVFNEGDKAAPRVAAGTYTVDVSYKDQKERRTLKVISNPSYKVSDADLQAQHQLLVAIRDQLSENHRAVKRIRDLRDQVKAWGRRAEAVGKGKALADLGKPLVASLEALERKLTNPDIQADEDDCVFPPQLDHDWVWLAAIVGSADARPTEGSPRFFDTLKAKQADVLKDLKACEEGPLAAFQKTADDLHLPRIIAAPEAP